MAERTTRLIKKEDGMQPYDRALHRKIPAEVTPSIGISTRVKMPPGSATRSNNNA
jgi:hypothetical protein